MHAKDVADLGQRKSQLFRLANEAHAFQLGRAVHAIAGGGALGIVQQADVFIEADRLRTDAKFLGQFADLHVTKSKPYSKV